MKGKPTLVRVLVILLAMVAMALAIPLSGVLADPSQAPTPPGVTSPEKGVPNPNDYFGFEVGSDYHLVNYPDSVNYFKKVSETSNRVKFQVVGKTSGTENFAAEGAFPPQDMVMAIISDKQNLDKLDTYKMIQQKLADPKSLGPGEADKLIAEGLPVVLVASSQHASEIAGTQMEIKLLYELATSNSAEVQEILKNTILLLLPSQNPDGMRMEVEWYNKYLKVNEDWAGGGVPWLYQKYTGHDDNRDWFMFNLPENQATGKILYQEWFPNVTYDIHQMGASGPRLFVPPFFDPPNPEIDPLVIREISLIGDTAAADLQAAGLSGVATNAIYDTWWHGGMRSAPYYHNMIGLLTEAASTELANPIYQEDADIKGSMRGISNVRQALNNYPDPYFPVENADKTPNWHLSDIIKYEQIATKGFLKAAARNKEALLRNFYNLNVKGIELGDPKSGKFEGAFAYVLPADQQRDPANTAKLVNTMIFTGNKVHQATAPIKVGDVTYPAGSYVFLLSQPFRQNLTGTLGVQKYPPRFQGDGKTPEAPYDVAGWSLWMQMGTPLVEVAQPFDTGSLKPVTEAPIPAGVVSGSGSMYAFGDEMNNATVARFKLLDAGYTLKWAMQGFGSFNPGATIVSGGDQSKLPALLSSLAKELGVSFSAIDKVPDGVTTKTLSKPRIAVYESFSGNADSGWYRLLLDEFGIPYTILRNPVNQPEIWANLAGNFDVIVLSDTSRTSLLNGTAAGRLPAEYTGGIGTAGSDALKAFVSGGKTLLALGNGYQFASTDMGLPFTNGLSGISRNDFYCPGSLLQTEFDDPTSPVAFGYNAKPGDKLDVYFSSSPAFTVTDPTKVKTVISYADSGNLMRSGWLLDTKTVLNGKAAAVEAAYGSGKVVAVSFKDHWRGQSWNNLKLSFNTFFYATAQ